MSYNNHLKVQDYSVLESILETCMMGNMDFYHYASEYLKSTPKIWTDTNQDITVQAFEDSNDRT